MAAAIELNFLLYGAEPPFSGLFGVETSLEERIWKLEAKILETVKTRVHPLTNKLEISIPNEAIFIETNDLFNLRASQIDLDNVDTAERSVSNELVRARRVADYDVLAAAEDLRLHLIVVPSQGK